MLDDLKQWVAGLARTEAQPPLWAPIPLDGADGAHATPDRLAPGAAYFRVRVHRIHLTYQREWFEKFAPMLLIATEFSYEGEDLTHPAVIGPAMIEQLGRAAPLSTTIAGTVVAGPHPLREPNVRVTMALHRLARGNVASGFLDVVEGAAKTLNVAAGVTPYTALVRVVVNGMSALTGGDRPLMARHDEFSPVEAGYFALISPTAQVDVNELRVANGELVERVDGQLRPFRAADHVLYSIDRVAPEDIDLTRLPLHGQWLTTLDEARKSETSDAWQSAKTNLSALIGMAFRSPDLTYGHAEELELDWTDKVKKRHERAQQRGEMGGAPRGLDAVRQRSLAVLDM